MVIHKWHGSPIQTASSWIQQEGKVLTHIKQINHLAILMSQSGALTRPCGVGCSSSLFFHASPPLSGFLSSWCTLTSAAHGVFAYPWMPTVDHTWLQAIAPQLPIKPLVLLGYCSLVGGKQNISHYGQEEWVRTETLEKLGRGSHLSDWHYEKGKTWQWRAKWHSGHTSFFVNLVVLEISYICSISVYFCCSQDSLSLLQSIL